jgi:hypothetical protein
MNKYIFYVAQESVFHHFKASHIHSDQSWWNDIHINIKKYYIVLNFSLKERYAAVNVL